MELARCRGVRGRHLRGSRDPDQRVVHAIGIASGADVQRCARPGQADGDGERSGSNSASAAGRGHAGATPAKSAAPSAPRAPGEIITDIQRELARRGYYDGTVDGLYGPRTDGAIRDFEQAAGLKPSTEPSEALLQAMVRAPVKLAKGLTGATPALRPPMPVRNDVADRPAPSKRVIALQRALADFGYGQIKPSGIIDAETQVAIEKFERERKLPVTGQPSDRVMREMTAMTGRLLE